MSEQPLASDFDDAPPVGEVEALMRTYCKGDLMFSEEVRPFPYVYDNPTGRLIAPVMTAVISAGENVLFLPDESDFNLQLLLSPEPIDEHSAAADRWRIYHGEPIDINWCAFFIDAAKCGRAAYDGDALMRANMLSEYEPALLKAINADRDRLKRALHAVDLPIEEPIAVGIDHLGMHVRARFDVVRVPFSAETADPDLARQAIDALLERAG